MRFNWALGRRKPEDQSDALRAPAQAQQPDGATLAVLSSTAGMGKKS